MKALKSSRSTGHDGLSVNLLKKIIVHITSPLTHILNLSISTGKCPNSLKIAKVIPIFKKDDPSLLTNYRHNCYFLYSISIFFRKIIYKRLYLFLNVNNLLIPNQFGFRKGHSTDYAIIQLLDKITESFANQEHIIGVFMDLSKAFDTIDHDILIYKLQRYGIGYSTFMDQRLLNQQKTICIVQTSESPKSNISCGSPKDRF